MHAGDDVGEHDDGEPVVGSQQEPRGHQPRVRRYGTYVRLVIVSLLVGLVVGVGSWWYFKPQEIPITCYQYDNAYGSHTGCVYGAMSESEPPPGGLRAGWLRINTVWTTTLEVPFDYEPNWFSGQRGNLCARLGRSPRSRRSRSGMA